jgi:hypothetical protein
MLIQLDAGCITLYCLCCWPDGPDNRKDIMLLTVSAAITIGRIIDASQRQVPVTWLTESGNILTGTIRSLEVRSGQDVREARVRVSATFEHWFDMVDVIRMVDSGEFALDYRA